MAGKKAKTYSAQYVSRLKEERDAMLRRAVAAERDWQAEKRRVDWLQKNGPFELRIETMTVPAGAVRISRWYRKYVSFHAFDGRDMREAIDNAIRVLES